MEQDEIKSHLAATGWRPNNSGHYTKEVPVRTVVGVTNVRKMRVVFNKLSLSIQMRSSVGSFWLRIGGAPYKQVRRTAAGGVQVITYIFPGA